MSDNASKAFHDDLVKTIPNLRAFAASLCGNCSLANDLVQDTLVKALTHQNSYESGTNLKAWLFTILRNSYFSQYRRARRELYDSEGLIADTLPSLPEQPAHADMEDFKRALQQLPPDQREALILVGAEGYSYEEAAAISGCAVGTVKSRVNRARNRLSSLLSIHDSEDLAPDTQSRAVYSRSARS
jgi:RNA polymerase sigma-70 factor, ECF subfamily